MSLWLPSLLLPTLSMTVGGSLEMPPKKLKGARLVIPAGEMVEVHATGRGTTHATIRWYRALRSSCAGSMQRWLEFIRFLSLLVLIMCLDRSGCKNDPLTVDREHRTIMVEER